ncbi:MAG: hypothetical protein HYT76_01555 [Deltaproteobacteria bacterium]|nr:hypothetical protein [Deltaproteobacteria bacterium]
MTPPQKRIWYYTIDDEGVVWHDKVPFDDPDLIAFFLKNLEPYSGGKFRVLCQGEECIISCQDIPYVVQEIDLPFLIFPGGYQEALDPTTLWVGKKNVLYCKVREGRFSARFNRKSYLELAKSIQQDPKSGQYYLVIDKKKYPIKVSP